ncbi:MAG: metallophosphoesterase family protein [Candidatus Omnitrophica bacterium]|nr:metallophosphoesterase family protein [Candidatus Omnitrophota bacterium]
MRIVVLSDTHIPRSAADLPAKIYDEIKRSDMVIHAGDFADEEIFEKIKGLGKEMHAVCGNMDSPGLRRRLKDKETINAGGLTIGLIHGHGAPRDIAQTARDEFGKVDAVIFGHSHATMNVNKDGVLLFNPGSPTDTIFAKEKTYGILEITNGKITGKIIKL